MDTSDDSPVPSSSDSPSQSQSQQSRRRDSLADLQAQLSAGGSEPLIREFKHAPSSGRQKERAPPRANAAAASRATPPNSPELQAFFENLPTRACVGSPTRELTD